MPETPINFAVLTVSDRCSAGDATDTSGPALIQKMEQQLGATCLFRAICPDEVPAIRDHLLKWATSAPQPDLILTTGGTGLSPRDVTPEATTSVIERPHPALLELARHRLYDRTPKAALSRGVAGTVRSTLIINLPGSQRGATETLDALADVLAHAVQMLQGGDHNKNDQRQRA
jgi:molybdenum cofactor synthesis domain-containing protein